MKKPKQYKSGEKFDNHHTTQYSKTLNSPHRYLAYRDFHAFVKNYGYIKHALDLGCGTGASTDFLSREGYTTIGVDKDPMMIKQARLNFPNLNFYNLTKMDSLSDFDLIFSCFVLFEISSKKSIVEYLNQASNSLKNNGLFYGITGSESLHQKNRSWAYFNVDYEENINPEPGNVVKLGLKDPKMEFYDYYWKEDDYRECFLSSRLELHEIYYPLGRKDDQIEWKDEIYCSPFAIFIAKKKP